MNRLARPLACSALALVGLLSATPCARAADEATLQRVQARVSQAAGAWCGRSSTLGVDGVRRCLLQVKVVDSVRTGPFAGHLFGLILITRSLLDQLDEDTAAFVLAHEVAHLALGHAKLKLAGAASAPATGAVQQALRAMEASIGNLPPEGTPEDPKLQELDADALGLLLSMRAGYPATAGVRFFKDLQSLPGLPQGTWHKDGTHPPIETRAAALRQHARAFCRLLGEQKPLIPAESRLQPQPDYRLQEALAATVPQPQCTDLEPEPT